MPDAVSSSLGIVAYLALFSPRGHRFPAGESGWSAGLCDRRIRIPEKLEIYECGEPAVGSSYVQFDLRFYVVALLFIIFDVEVAFFFPWATVFGKATHLATPGSVGASGGRPVDGPPALDRYGHRSLSRIGCASPTRTERRFRRVCRVG